MFSHQVEAGQEYAGLGPAKEKGVDLEDEETRVMWEGIALGYALGPRARNLLSLSRHATEGPS